MRTISKWRTIDPAKLAQRIKGLAIGSDKPFEVNAVRGIGATSKDTDLKQRIINAITPPAHPTAEEAQAELEATLAEQQLQEAKELTNG